MAKPVVEISNWTLHQQDGVSWLSGTVKGHPIAPDGGSIITGRLLYNSKWQGDMCETQSTIYKLMPLPFVHNFDPEDQEAIERAGYGVPAQQHAVDLTNPWADLWYFVMDEASLEFERIVTTVSPKNWHSEAHKLMRAKYPAGVK